ncbi:MAG: MalY/PatB family protein [Clostridia bacterium]
MKYNFDEHINRYGTNCSKWDHADENFHGNDLLPLWVADTDFRVPYEVVEAMQERLNHPIFGYTTPDDELYEVIIDKVKRHYNWDIKKEWIFFTNGVVSACHIAVRSFVNIGDEVMIQNPVYYPFQRLIKANGMHPVDNTLIRKDDKYYMDFGNMENLFKSTTGFGARTSRVKAAILCNPHNPVGRVWTKEELKNYGDICVENDAIIISDDIHCDLLLNENEHTLIATLDKRFEDNSITIIAPSKTFNIAGLKGAVTIIPNQKLREDFALTQMAGYNSPNILALEALKAAYKYGDDYIQELNSYLEKNLDFLTNYINENIPEITVIEPEGTYLVWLDMRKLEMNSEQLAKFMVEEAKVATDFGHVFGTGGEGYQRLNIGCTKETLEKALDRLNNAITEWRSKN